MQNTLTLDQLNQLVNEYTNLRNWTVVRDFCDQVYGPGVVRTVTMETHGEYNDEGGTDYSVECLYAVDSNSEYVDYDLTLPFWQVILKQPLDPGEEEDQAHDALRDWYPSKEERGSWLSWEDLPCNPHTGDGGLYELAHTPTVSFVVYPTEKAIDLATTHN
jgi:hypothetical protein